MKISQGNKKMGLGIAISGFIVAAAMLLVIPILHTASDNFYDITNAKFEMSNIENSIKKTGLEIHSIGAISDNSSVSFNFTNTKSEKLWNYEKFNLFITYDANIDGGKTRTSEQLAYNSSVTFTGVGSAGCIGDCDNALNGGIIRPIADLVDSNWIDTEGGNSDGLLFDEIDEPVRDDSDYASTDPLSVGNPSDTLQVELSDVTDPQRSDGHIVRYVYRKDAAGGVTVDITIRLLQGAAEIASWIHSDIGSTFSLAQQTLSTEEANSITAYSDLRLEFIGQWSSGVIPLRRAEVSWAEFEVPFVLREGASGGLGASCSGRQLGAGEWTVNSLGGDYMDPKIINPNEVGVICNKLSHPIYTKGNVTVVLSTDMGQGQNGTITAN